MTKYTVWRAFIDRLTGKPITETIEEYGRHFVEAKAQADIRWLEGQGYSAWIEKGS